MPGTERSGVAGQVRHGMEGSGLAGAERKREQRSGRERDRRKMGKRLCGWYGCGVEVDAKLWGCRDHWFKLPPDIRRRIMAHYRDGQEVGKVPPSHEYMSAITDAARWIRDRQVRP